MQYSAFDVEADKVGCVIREWLYALDGSQQPLAINNNLVGVILRNDSVVIRISALDESAVHRTVVEEDKRIAVVESHHHLTVVLHQHILKQ